MEFLLNFSMSRNRFGRLLAELSTSATSRIHNCFISRCGSKTNHIVRSMAEHGGIANGLALPSAALLCCCCFPLEQRCKGNLPAVLCDFVSTNYQLGPRLITLLFPLSFVHYSSVLHHFLNQCIDREVSLTSHDADLKDFSE